MEWLAVAVATASGAGPIRVTLLVATLNLPIVVLAVTLWSWTRARASLDPIPDSARFCEAVAAELMAGAGLRQAVTEASRSVEAADVGQAASRGLGMDVVLERSVARFPDIAGELEMLFPQVGEGGPGGAAVFTELAWMAAAEREMVREVMVAMAPARATAAILIGAPLVFVVVSAGSGGLGLLLGTSPQRSVAAVGFALMGAGVGVAAWVARRGR